MVPTLVRICYPAGGAEVMIKSDGTAVVSGYPVDIHEKIVGLFHIPNITQVKTAQTVEACYKRMETNDTDVIITKAPPTEDEGAIYYIAIQTHQFVNQIVSGYDYSQYVKAIEDFKVSASDILKNFTLFSPAIIMLCILFYLSVGLIVRLVSFSGLDRCYSRALAPTWRQRASFCYKPVITSKLIQFILKAGFFLLSSPFLAEFSTNQVVTKSPDVITTYREVIDQGAKVIFNREVSDEKLVKPKAESIAQNDISAKLFRYMKRNLYEFPLSSSTHMATSLEQAVAALIAGKMVMFAANDVSDSFSNVFCSWSNEGHLIQSLVSTDPSSREIFSGLPMRKGFYNDAIVKNLRRVFEAHLQRAVIDVSPQYLGFDLKRSLTTAEHRRQQLVLCMADTLIRDQREPQPTGFRSFSFIFALYLSFNLTILIVHLIFKI